MPATRCGAAAGCGNGLLFVNGNRPGRKLLYLGKIFWHGNAPPSLGVDAVDTTVFGPRRNKLMIGGIRSMRIRGTLFAVPLLLATTALYAQEYGSADEAKAMLESTVTQMEADKEGTIQKINNGEIKDKDLYPYCGGPDGMVTAHPDPNVRTMSLKSLKDKKGNAFLEDVYDKVEEGEFTEVEYVWTRPGEDKPVDKVAYLTKVDDQVCGVGYYKE
jgi:hypothetical protein